MLEKNKDYLEIRVSSTDCAFTQNAATTISIEVFSYDTSFRLPDPGESYVIVSKEKFEKLQADNQHYRERAKQLEENYNLLLQKTGFDTVESLVYYLYYLNDIIQCDTLLEVISSYISERDKAAEAFEKEIGVYSRALKEWKEITGYPSPSAVKTALESGASWCHAYNETKKANEKLADDVKSWKNVTGYSTPEDYMHARLNNTTPFDYTAVWQDATGCVTPDQVKSRIEGLENAIRLTNKNMLSEFESNIDEWQKFTGCDSPQNAGCKINNLCDEICKLKGDYDYLLGLTGYKSALDVRIAIDDKEYKYRTMRDLVNSLKRKANFTESNWKAATGCNTPGEAETTMRNLKGRIDEIKEFAAIASNWTDRIVED